MLHLHARRKAHRVALERCSQGSTTTDISFPITSRPSAASAQNDGVLDSYFSRVKFGLMTFDGAPTLVGGSTLVPTATYAAPGFMTQQAGAQGMYSYGANRSFTFRAAARHTR